MVNSNSQIDLDWVNDANALESDLTFNSDGSPKQFYHGLPCDCGRLCLKKGDVTTHFGTIRRKAQNYIHDFALFWIDLKLRDSEITDFYSSGKKLAEEMTKVGSLFPPGEVVPINVLLGAEYLDQKDFFRGFRQYILEKRPELLPKFGYDFSSTSLDIEEILNTFEEMGITENIWIGDGITNCLLFTRDDTRLKEILNKRDSNTSGLAPFKVYAWTADSTSDMRDRLQLGVDAIIVNYPNRLHALVTDEFRNSLYLAKRSTNPWKRIRAYEALPPLARGCSQGYCWKYISPDDWCWTPKECSTAEDCWGNISCT